LDANRWFGFDFAGEPSPGGGIAIFQSGTHSLSAFATAARETRSTRFWPSFAIA